MQVVTFVAQGISIDQPTGYGARNSIVVAIKISIALLIQSLDLV